MILFAPARQIVLNIGATGGGVGHDQLAIAGGQVPEYPLIIGIPVSSDAHIASTWATSHASPVRHLSPLSHSCLLSRFGRFWSGDTSDERDTVVDLELELAQLVSYALDLT